MVREEIKKDMLTTTNPMRKRQMCRGRG